MKKIITLFEFIKCHELQGRWVESQLVGITTVI